MVTSCLPIDSVNDTAFLTAHCRALESARPDAHFRDPYAGMLADERGTELLGRLDAPELVVNGCTVRTHLLDQLILTTIAQDKVDAVLNLGAGLDTRPYRLALPPKLLWLEVDSPEVLAYKQRRLVRTRPSCEIRRISLDLRRETSRRSALSQIGERAESVLVLTEGLLIYLEPQQVVDLARDLREGKAFRYWVSDLVSPLAARLAEIDKPAQREGVTLSFTPVNGWEFFSVLGWQADRWHSCLAAAEELDRWFMAKELRSHAILQDHRDHFDALYTVARLVVR